MVVFRRPDHLTQALEACVAIREQYGVRAERGGAQSPYSHGVSIGLDSGEVVFGGLGGPELGRLDYTVLGDVVDTASRLAVAGKRGQLLIAERLRQRVEEAFECRPTGTQAVFEIVGRRGAVVPSGDPTLTPRVHEPATQSQEPRLTALTGR
jgi:class 3 adenylate cyclase